MKKALCTIIALVYSAFVSIKAQDKKVVIGYFANTEWNKLADANKEGLTHINISFSNPTESGEIDVYRREEIKAQMKGLQEQGIKVLIAVAGGGLSDEQRRIWAEHIRPDKVDAFIEKIMNLLLTDGYDGIDLDLEHDVFLNMLGQNYAPFVKKLHKRLKEHNLLLTTALFGTHRYSVMTSDVLKLFDYINIMTYDATGNWDLSRPGQHSSIDLAKNGINYWKNQGVPAEKIILGLPFYGYDFDSTPLNPGRDFTYNSIVKLDPKNAYLDEVGKKYYNGINTIKVKTLLSEKECGGVMIWHISCDTKDQYSLLKAIQEAKTEYKQNIAIGKTASSSELEYDHTPASNATDGNPTTRWSAKPLNPAYLTIDLEEEQDIYSITIDWESSYAKTYVLEVSNDGESWTKLKSFENQELQDISGHALQEIKDLDSKARYIRLKITKGTVVNGRVWCYSIWDLRVNGTKSSPTAISQVDKVNIQVYPNPTTDKITIKGLNEEELINIYSIRGLKLLSTKAKTIDISHLQKGTYILKTKDNSIKIIRK